MKVPALLKNKYVCYGLMALAGLNVAGYVTVKSWECLALFLLTAYSAKCYTKNMSLAILAALFISNIVFGCGRVTEGMMDSPSDLLKKAEDLAGKAADKADTPEGEAAAKDVKDAAEDAAAFVASQEACCDDNGRLSGLDDDAMGKCDAGNFCKA